MIDIGVNRMKNYLKQAIECEKNVYIWSESMKRVNEEMEQLYKDQEVANNELNAVKTQLSRLDTTYKEKSQIQESQTEKFAKASKSHRLRCIFMLLLMPIIFVGWVAISFFILVNADEFFPTILICFCLLAILEAAPIVLFIVSKKKIKSYTRKSVESKNVNLAVIREDETTQLTKKKTLLTERCAWLMVAEQCITDWQDEIHQSYKQALATRQKLYSLNILDPCYQNFFCVTMFYDYLQTGQVNTINGFGGLASTLKRDQMHWEQMAVLNDLRRIAENTNLQQRYLLQEAREANRIQRQISNQLADLNQTAEFIHIQQARTAEAANRIDSQLRYGY